MRCNKILMAKKRKISDRAVKNKDGSITIEEGNGYACNARRVDVPSGSAEFFGNAFTFVIFTVSHPNWGYFGDGGFFWKSMHRNWEYVPIVRWVRSYDIEMEETKKSPIMSGLKKIAGKDTEETLPTSINMFLEDYPEFRELFEE